MRIGQRRLRIQQTIALRGTVDFGHQLPLAHLVTQLDMQALDLTRNLRAHIDEFVGLNHARGQNRVFQAAALNRRAQHLGRCILLGALHLINAKSHG